jgi:hypothetical protein
MVLASPGPLLTPPPPSSQLKTPIRSYSAETPPRNGNPTQPPPGGSGGSRRERGTRGKNWPQADEDLLQHPCHSVTAKRQSADDMMMMMMSFILQPTKRQPATTGADRAGWESHDCKSNNNEDSPRLHPPDHRHTLSMHSGSSKCTVLQMTYTDVNPHACCNGPRPEDAHADTCPTPHPHTLTHLTNIGATTTD